jgi:non-ribosomal peptide synthetase component F
MYAFEMWGQLTAGGTVVLPKSDHLMPSGLRQLIDHNGADTVFLTTTLFNLFVDEDPACFTGVRTLYIGGEKLSSAHVRTFLKYQPTVAISNCYGPAENCMLTTTRLIEPSDCDIPEGIPIGVAVPRSAVVVIGESGRPCEPGELGEVCASGDGLAIGYLGQPGLTAEKFPTVTIDGVPTRIYRTGDFGFLDKLGVLQFRGRYDRQVKVSGYRIELGEIETAARQLAGVRECVALPMNDSEGRVTGIALCYLPEHGEAADTGSTSPPDYSESGIRRALRQVLPAHIMPASVRKFDRFPMTANGKVDATALDLAAKAAR